MNSVSVPVKKRVVYLTWSLPIVLLLLAILSQFGLLRWLDSDYSPSINYIVAYLLVALLGSSLVFFTIRQIGFWLDEADQAANRNRKKEDQLAHIMDTSADAILTLDSKGCINGWNYGAESLFGFEDADVLGYPFSDLLGGGSAAEVESHWLVEEVQRTSLLRGHETTCVGFDGRRIDVELTATRIGKSHNGHAGLSLILRDITRRKRKEEETRLLNEALNRQAIERNHELAIKVKELGRANNELYKLDQTRSEFVSLVSHQIRAPLTNMGGAVQRMQADCKAINPTCTRMFTIFEQQVDRLDRLVQDVLNASLLEAGEVSLHPEPISVLSVVRQSTREIQARRLGRTIILAEKPGLPLVYADRDRVTEVIANLLDNADKYSPAGEEINVQVRADQNEVTVSVRNAGTGIPADKLDRIFDKFYRTDTSDSQLAYGYGLGLYVCRRLIEAQGGHIWAENHPDGGSIFSFALPVWQERHEPQKDLIG